MQLKRTIKKQWEYHFINTLVFLILCFLFLSIKYNWIYVSCLYAEQGMKCSTCGLTTAFQQLLNGEQSAAPTHFKLLFYFFLIQLILRPSFSFALLINDNIKHVLARIDILFVALAFCILLYFFQP